MRYAVVGFALLAVLVLSGCHSRNKFCEPGERVVFTP